MILASLESFVGIILTIFIVVGVHEGAHFLVAKCLGIKVLRFSIGFGKALYSWHDKKGTEYVIAPIPLGGYVKLLDENEGVVPEQDKPLAFNRQPIYKRFAVVVAGPISNLLLAAVLYWIIFMIGFQTPRPIIGEVEKNSIASLAGLQSQQEIISVDQHNTSSWPAIIMQLITHIGDNDTAAIGVKTFRPTLHQAHEPTKHHLLNLQHWQMNALKPDPLSSVGITPYLPKKLPASLLQNIKYGPIEAVSAATNETVNLSYLNLLLFWKLITHKLSVLSLGGPITIFESAGSAFQNGLISFFSFLAFLNVALGIINIFPIPGLDGGHLFFQLIEAVTRRPLSMRTQILAYRLGFIFLFFVLAQALSNDLMRLW